MNETPRSRYENIPAAMRAERRWVAFAVHNGKKRPVNPLTLRGGKSNDPTTWATIETAIAAIGQTAILSEVGEQTVTDIGFALGDGWAGIDLDNHGGADITMTPEIEAAFDELRTYKERSASGKGLHYYGRYNSTQKLEPAKMEIHTGGRFYVVTGDIVGDQAEVADITSKLPELAKRFAKHQAPDQKPANASPWSGHDPWSEDDVRDMLSFIPANERGTWRTMGMALKAEGFSFELFDEWSSKAHNYGGTEKAWRSFRRTGVGMGTIIFNAEENGWQNPRRKPRSSGNAPQDGCFTRPGDFTDVGNAKALADYMRGVARYSDSIGWLVWDGSRWSDDPHRVELLAQDFTDAMLDDALKALKDEITGSGAQDGAKAYLSHARRTRSRGSIENALKLTRPRLAVKADELDKNSDILNTPAGIVDLATGELRPHDKDQLCTKITRTAPGYEGEQLWEEFLDRITGNDSDMKEYLQTVAGSCAMGRVCFEGICFAIGAGRNGKSTFYNALCGVLGDYAGTIDSRILTTTQQNKGPAIATLRGKRLVVCGELEEGQRLSVQTLKQLCSTDRITAERKYHDPEDFLPSHHLAIFTNFMPRVGSTDEGTWRRIMVVPFTQVMPSGAADIPNYAELLIENAGPAILSWIIDGATKFIADGCHIYPPQSVREATAAYKQEEDWLSSFIRECCTIGKGYEALAGDLYERYRTFALSEGDYVRRQVDFARGMEKAGFEKRSVGGHRKAFRGIKPIVEWP